MSKFSSHPADRATRDLAIEVSAELFKSAAKLNLNTALDGEPCKAVFRAARAVLMTAFGNLHGEHISALAIDTGEFEKADLLRHSRDFEIGGHV
jgi:hypothetical protein